MMQMIRNEFLFIPQILIVYKNLQVLYLGVQLDFIGRQVLGVWFRRGFSPLQAGDKV